jgi:hypothetical protein
MKDLQLKIHCSLAISVFVYTASDMVLVTPVLNAKGLLVCLLLIIPNVELRACPEGEENCNLY